MAEATLNPNPISFPVGSKVKIYAWTLPAPGGRLEGAPPGALLSEPEVAQAGTLTVTGLEEGKTYVAWRVTEGTDRYLFFQTGGTEGGLAFLGGDGTVGGPGGSSLSSSIETNTALAGEAVVFVRKGGSDANSGLSPGHAFLTIKKGIEYLKALSGKGKGIVDIGVGQFVEPPLVRPSLCLLRGCGENVTEIKQAAGGNGNVVQSDAWGVAGVGNEGGGLEKLLINGNKAEQAIARAETATSSNGVVINTFGGVTLPVLNEPAYGRSTANFPASGQIYVGRTLCEYTSKTATAFEGVKGVFKSLTTGEEMVVVLFNSQGHGIAEQGNRVTIRDVRTVKCVNSGRCFQTGGQSGGTEFSYQNKIENAEDYEHGGWGLEVVGNATDSQVTNWTGGACVRGDIFAGGGNWTWAGIHPIGESKFTGARAPSLIRIAAPNQQFVNLAVDSAPYESIVLDCLANAGNVVNILINGQLFKPSISSAGAGAGLMVYGSSAHGAAALQVNLGVNGRVSAPYVNGPLSYLVGVQNLEAPAAGNVQIVSSMSFAPNSTMGGTITVEGSGTLAYTGRSSAGSSTAEEIAAGATTMKLIVPAGETLESLGFATSGTVTVFPPSTASGPVAALRIAYTGISGGNKLTGIPASGPGSIPEALPSVSGVAQHFLTGVTGGTGAAVADGTVITQSGRAGKEVTGDVWLPSPEKAMQESPSLAGLTTSGFAGMIFNAGGTWKTPTAGIYRLTCCAGGGGGGGGGAAALTAGTATQVGGAGGGAGQFLERIVTLAAGVTLTAVIGAGGEGKAGGAASSGVTGNAGTEGAVGSNSSLSGGGVTLSPIGGRGGAGGLANSATTSNGGSYANQSGLTASATNSPAGWGGPATSTTGFAGGLAMGLVGRGGGGGGPASATEGGKGGGATATVTKTGALGGATSANATPNTGQGGEGGGGGAPGGAGGNGGNGGSGWAAVVRVG